MSVMQEKFRLSGSEIGTILAMAGRGWMVGFETNHHRPMSEQVFWDACCAMHKDGLISQSGEGFQLEQTLGRVIMPMIRADEALVLTPGTDTSAQVIYYCFDRVTVMERLGQDWYSLSNMDMLDLTDDLQERMELEFMQLPSRQEPEPEPSLGLDASWEALCRDALFLLEQMDLRQGKRVGWIRGVRRGLFTWLEWTQGETYFCVPLTLQALRERLYGLEGVETG